MSTAMAGMPASTYCAATAGATDSSIWNSMIRSGFCRTSCRALRTATFGSLRLLTWISSMFACSAARIRLAFTIRSQPSFTTWSA